MGDGEMPAVGDIRISYDRETVSTDGEGGVVAGYAVQCGNSGSAGAGGVLAVGDGEVMAVGVIRIAYDRLAVGANC